MRLLLHACCGPCSLEPTRIFAEEGFDFAIDYTNPNIAPEAEYEHRLSTLRTHVIEAEDIPFFEGEYDPETWEREVAIHGTDREARCRACYRLRLERVAARAAQLGFDAISTTLTISPYQMTEVIFEELKRAAEAVGIQAVCRDFRDRYPEATRRSRAEGLYRQNYCGCRFSMAEAAEQRAKLQKQRAAAKAIKHEALIWASAEGSVNQANQL